MVSLYQIENLRNGKLYYGKTHLSIAERWKKHLKDARAGRSWAISRAIRKYGQAAFNIKLLFNVDTEQEANEAERTLIAVNKTNYPENGYNLTLGGDGFSDPTPEFKARRAATLRATLKKPEVKARQKNFSTGQFNPNTRPEIPTAVILVLYADSKSLREVQRVLSFGGVKRRLLKEGVHIRGRHEFTLGRPHGTSSK